jgi:alpha-beta hydrolase superfamily lysophospholipase
LERRFWRELIHGRVRLAPAVRTIARFGLAAVRTPAATGEAEQASDPASRLGKTLQQVDVPVHLVLSGCDRTADVLRSEAARNVALKAAFARPTVSVKTYAEADHTFSDRGDRDALITHLQGWLTEDRSIRDQSSQKGTCR